MARLKIYALKRMPVGKKILLSLMLIGGALGYVTSWATTLQVAKWAISSDESLLRLGTVARLLAWNVPKVFAFVVLANVAASAILVACSVVVFRNVALRRAAKRGLILATVFAFGLGIFTWLTAPFFWWSEMTLLATNVVMTFFCLVLITLPLSQMWFFTRYRPSKKKRVVVVGGGFAGLDVAQRLDAKIGWSEDIEIVLVDRRNYFLFPPLLPSVAAGTIETRQVTYPFRRIFETTNVIFRKAEVTAVDPLKKRLTSRVEFDHSIDKSALAKSSSLSWDVLVLSPGAVSQTFNTPGVQEHALFMRELGDAIAVRNHVIDCFEQAAAAASRTRQRELLRFVVVGAGPTGIELATEVHDLAHHVLLSRYPEVMAEDIDVSVVQSGEQVLPGWDNKLVDIATKQLKRLSIRLILGTRVTEVGPRHALLKNGERLQTRSVFWCAGVRAHPLLNVCGLDVADSGRAIIERDMRAQGHDDIFVVGDAAHLIDDDTGRPFPPLGQVAFQQGAQCADNVLRLLRDEKLKPFKYFNFGSLVSVGENFAAVHLLGVHLSGFIGWFVWRTLYLGKLVGAGNKIRVVIDWTLDLLVERSISQIREHERTDAFATKETEHDDTTFDARAVHLDLAQASSTIAGVTTRESYTATTAESAHTLESDPSVHASVVIRPVASNVVLEFEATLPTHVAYQAHLTREDALLGRDAHKEHDRHNEVDELGLGSHFLVDTDESCLALFARVKPALIELAALNADITFDGTWLRVLIPNASVDTSDLAPLISTLLNLWKDSAEGASDQKPRAQEFTARNSEVAPEASM